MSQGKHPMTLEKALSLASLETPESLRARVAARFNITVEQMLSKERNQLFMYARAVTAWILSHRGFSNSEIGRYLGRHDTTVIGPIAEIEKQRQGSDTVDKQLQDLMVVPSGPCHP